MSLLQLAPPEEVIAVDEEAAVRRRVGLIWALLFLDVLSFSPSPTIITIPSRVGQGITQGALWLALLLALTVNRRGELRLNVFLVLTTLLGVIAFIVTVPLLHLGMTYRAIRLVGFITTLWLITPWFGRRDLFLLRCHLRCLVGVILLTVAAMAISPHKAFQQGRLFGAFWPIPTTQLAHYASVAIGIGVVLWMSGLLRRNAVIALIALGLPTLLLTHTRTALIGLVAGVIVAGASLFVGRRRVRRAFAIAMLVVAIGGAVAAPAVSHWFVRGESPALFTNLTGRTVVWNELVNTPRTKAEVLFGSGLSNDSFQGLSIDSSWLSLYETQGLVGDVLVGLFLLALLVIAATRPRGPGRAVALFIVTYCIIASITETGLGEASTYLLDLTIAASVLMSPLARRPMRDPALSP